MNPYQPPQSGTKAHSFSRRLLKALGMAWSAYRKGMKQDGVKGREHFAVWLTLLAVVFAFLLSLVSAVYLFVELLRPWLN
ncbi:MAG: hypothetical protein AAF664_12505 [Planctomycetota bacterium]